MKQFVKALDKDGDGDCFSYICTKDHGAGMPMSTPVGVCTMRQVCTMFDETIKVSAVMLLGQKRTELIEMFSDQW